MTLDLDSSFSRREFPHFGEYGFTKGIHSQRLDFVCRRRVSEIQRFEMPQKGEMHPRINLPSGWLPTTQ